MSLQTAAGAQAAYFEALSKGQFQIQRCSDCSSHVFYPRQFCPYCDSSQLQWVDPKGTGTVYSVTTVRRKPEAGGDYNVSLIDLDEGVRLLSRVEGISPAEVRIGMLVAVQVVEHKGTPMVVFHPVDNGGAK